MIVKATAHYSGGGIYIYQGELDDGNYFIASDLDKGKPGDIRILNDDPKNEDELEPVEWEESHLVRDIDNTTQEAWDFWNEMLDYILKNEPEGNYDIGELEERKAKPRRTNKMKVLAYLGTLTDGHEAVFTDASYTPYVIVTKYNPETQSWASAYGYYTTMGDMARAIADLEAKQAKNDMVEALANFGRAYETILDCYDKVASIDGKFEDAFSEGYPFDKSFDEMQGIHSWRFDLTDYLRGNREINGKDKEYIVIEVPKDRYESDKAKVIGQFRDRIQAEDFADEENSDYRFILEQ